MKCANLLSASALALTLSLVAWPQEAAAQPAWITAYGGWQVQATAGILTYNVLAVGVTGASTANGAPVIQWGQNTSPDQKWRFEYLGGGYYRIVNVNSGKVLDVAGYSTDNGAPIHQWDWHGGHNQQWRIYYAASPGGYLYRFQNRHSGKYLDVPNNSEEWGKQLIQWDWNGGSNQKFSTW